MRSRENNKTYKKILQASIELFQKENYDEVNIRQLADATGVNVSAIYYYFPEGKQAIAKKICSDFTRRCEKEVHSVFDNLDVLDFTLVLYRLILRELSKAENDLRFYVNLWIQSDYIPPLMGLMTHEAFKNTNNSSYEEAKKISMASTGIWCSLYKAKFNNLIHISDKEIRDYTDHVRMLMMGFSPKQADEKIANADLLLKRIPTKDIRILEHFEE